MKKYFLLFIILLLTTHHARADYQHYRLLKYGKKGEDVRELQKCLNRIGYSVGFADGIFGRKTYRGVKSFQKNHGLFPDAIIGRKTGPKFELACSQKNPKQNNDNGHILFKSNFEKGTDLENPVSDDGGIWWQEIKGSDVQGYSWPININGKGSLQLIVDADKNIQKYISNTIETVLDNSGKPTRALHQNIMKKQYGHTQDPYIIYTDGKEVDDLYIKYSMKLPKNINELLDDDGYIVLTEYKTTGDYRLAFYIYKDEGSGRLYWYVHGDNVVIDGVKYKEFWYRENYEVPVPVGKWFDVELFWHLSKKDDGRVWWAIDGKTIVDYHGQTKIKNPINAIMVFTNYASNPIHQWIDNLEIANNFPCGVGKSCLAKN